MGLFGSKEERIKKRDYSKEKKARYEGTNMQAIGQIPIGVNVILSLDPEKELLNIGYKTINISLPYNRIKSFTCTFVTTDKTNNILKGAQNFLQTAEASPKGFDPLGAKKLVAGLAGNVASNLIPVNLIVHTIAILSYIDKNGQNQQLQFNTTRETGHIINTEENIQMYHDYTAINFSEIITMITSRHAESITEL